MKGGDLHWIWKPYGLYQEIDYVSLSAFRKPIHILTTYEYPRYMALKPTNVGTGSQTLNVRFVHLFHS
jgi:hypothetical protein